MDVAGVCPIAAEPQPNNIGSDTAGKLCVCRSAMQSILALSWPNRNQIVSGVCCVVTNFPVRTYRSAPKFRRSSALLSRPKNLRTARRFLGLVVLMSTRGNMANTYPSPERSGRQPVTRNPSPALVTRLEGFPNVAEAWRHHAAGGRPTPRQHFPSGGSAAITREQYTSTLAPGTICIRGPEIGTEIRRSLCVITALPWPAGCLRVRR